MVRVHLLTLGVTYRYRMTSEMKSLGATILHAMMHYNTIGETAGLTEVRPLCIWSSTDETKRC